MVSYFWDIDGPDLGPAVSLGPIKLFEKSLPYASMHLLTIRFEQALHEAC